MWLPQATRFPDPIGPASGPVSIGHFKASDAPGLLAVSGYAADGTGAARIRHLGLEGDELVAVRARCRWARQLSPAPSRELC
jgi:hypothetical protein